MSNFHKFRKGLLRLSAPVMLLVILFTSHQMFGQAASYTFSTSTGVSLVDMTAATTFPISGDDAASAVTSIGFNFTFCGTVYTQFSANTNGLMRLGAAVVSTAYSNAINSATDNPKICPWWDDQHTGTGGSVKYLLTGIAPNRKLVVQWNLVNCCGGTPDKTYQVWLNETANTVQYVYGTMSGTASSSVGLCNALNDFNAVLTSTNTNYTTGTETTNSTIPASGRTYIFAPPTPCTGTPVAGSIPLTQGACSGSATTITASGYTMGVSGITFQWEESPDGVTGWINAVGGTGSTTAAFTTPVITGTKYYRLKVTCTATGLFAYTNACTVNSIACSFDITYSTGASYTSIMPTAGGTGLPMPGWQNTSGDDNTSNTVSVSGTTFTYQGTPITGFRVCSNGWMSFNTATTATTFSNGLTASTPNMVLAPFWDDLVFTGQNYANRDACVRYQIDGALGSGLAVITIEWAGMERYSNPGPNWNFQVKLYEETNNIEYVYGPFEGYDGTNYTSHSYSIGYNGTNPAGTTASDRFALQAPLTNYFSSASDPAANAVNPYCYSKYTLIPGTYTGPVTTPAIPVPSNDNSAGATVLTVNPVEVTSPYLCSTFYTSRGATNSGVGAAPCATAGTEDDDVWFTFTTGTLTDYSIKVRPSPGYDAVLQLYSAAMAPISCANAVGVSTSTVAGIETIAATGLSPLTQYYVRVYNNTAGYGTSGEFSINVYQTTPPPANDNCAGAISVAVGTSCSYTAGTSLTATSSAGEVAACIGTADDDVWYSFVATASNPVINVQSGGGYNAVLSVYSGTCGALSNLYCINATTTAGLETVNTAGLTIGATYYIRIYHNATGAGSGNFSLCVYNPVPDCSTYSSPADGTTGVLGTGTTLTWNAAAYATSYDVYFDVVNPPLTLTNVATTSYATGPLAPATTYYWKVIPKNDLGAAAGCTTVWSFTSVAGCTGTPAAGTALSTSTSVCSGATSFTLSLSGADVTAGITYQWQSDAGAGYSNIGGATAATYSATEAVTTNYRCQLTCTATGLSSISIPVSVSFTPSPVGDVFASPIIIGSLPYTAVGNNQSANCWHNDFTGQSSPDVYYRFIPTCNGTLNINMCSGGTLSDTYIHLLDATGIELALNDDSGPSCTGLLSSLNYVVNAGATYYIVVEGFSTNEGTYTLNVSNAPFSYTWYADADGDSYGNAASTTTSCDGLPPAGYVGNALDCNDGNAAVNPAATEVCNGFDDDCDALVDAADPGVIGLTAYYADADGDGFGNPAGMVMSCTAPVGYVTDNTDCNDAQIQYQDLDGDGYGTATMVACGAAVNTDCDDVHATAYPGAVEVCDGFDNDCNGLIDEGTVTATVTPAPSAITCKGVPVVFQANTGVGYTYQWFKNGNLIIGATASTYSTDKAGYYQVQVNIPAGCFALSAASSLSVNPNPNSNISAPNGTSLCGVVKLKASYDASYAWQWFKDGSPIAGATTYIYNPSLAGSYYCLITSALGCSRATATIIVTACRDAATTVSNQISVFPNPTEDIFTLELTMSEAISGNADIYVTNMTGAIVYNAQSPVKDGYLNQNISLGSNIAAGVYMVKVIFNGAQYNQQITVVK